MTVAPAFGPGMLLTSGDFSCRVSNISIKQDYDQIYYWCNECHGSFSKGEGWCEKYVCNKCMSKGSVWDKDINAIDGLEIE